MTEANLNYVGSITIDAELMEKSGILEYEKVQIVNVNNGKRLETYAILGKKRGEICLNGAAARCVEVGDKIIIMSYCELDILEAKKHKPEILIIGNQNEIIEVINSEEN